MLSREESHVRCHCESDRPVDSDLAWSAMQYLLDELPVAERDAFEELLDQSQEAREALVEASLLVEMLQSTAPQQNGPQLLLGVVELSTLQTSNPRTLFPSTAIAPVATTQPLPGKSESDCGGTSGLVEEQSTAFTSSLLCHDRNLPTGMTNANARCRSATCEVAGGTSELLRAKTGTSGQECTRRPWMSSRIWLSGCFLLMMVGCVLLWNAWHQSGANQLADRDLATTLRSVKRTPETISSGMRNPSNISHHSDLVLHWVETQQSLLDVDAATDSLAGLDSEDDWSDAHDNSLEEMSDVFEAPAWMLAGVQHRTRSEEETTP